MKKIVTVMMMLASAIAFAAPQAASAKVENGSNIVQARSKIAAIIGDPKQMATVMKSLSAKEQCQFLGEVNKAISKMSCSEEQRAAVALNVNRSALDGAAKGNLAPVVAEIFATAPVATLTVINESFSKTVFNRAADPKVTYTDEQYAKLAGKVMEKIVSRLESAEDAGVRSGFAALMMVRASNSENQQIRDAVVATLPKSVQETAKNEWLPAALAEGDAKSYEPMLGMAATEVSRPVEEQVLRIAGPQQTDALLSDLAGAATDPKLDPSQADPVTAAVFAPTQNDLPQSGSVSDSTEVIGEIKGYQGQILQ